MKCHAKNILIYYIAYMTVKNLSYIKIYSLNRLYPIINKVNRHIEESNRKRYLTLVLTDKSKGILEEYEELWNQITDLIRSKTY